MQKRGEITSTQIIGIVISIIGLVIIVVFLGIIFNGYDSSADMEACRLSILTRATAPTIAQANVPLKCSTQKICVTDKLFGGECEQFAGEDNVVTVKVNGDDIDKAKQIEKIMAENMYTCWSMTGQGKLDLFGKATNLVGFGDADSTCIICSRVALDDQISNETLKLIDLDTYLENNYIPLQGSSLTYVEAFTNRGANSFGSARQINEDLNKSTKDANVEIKLNSGDGRQVAFVFAQVKTAKVTDVLANLGIAAVGATFAVPGSAKIASALYLGPQAFVTVPLTAIGVGGAALNTYQNQLAAAGYCGEFTTAEEKDLRDGCSLVQGVPYTVQNINSLCTGSIQSTP